MCFGNSTDKTTTSSSSGPSWLTSAAQGNIASAQQLQSNGFTPYSGQQVASFSPQQAASFGAASNLSDSVNGGPIGTALNNYTTAGPQSVTPQTISSQMSPYMNQYVGMALTPQLQAQDLQFAGQNKAVDSAASMAGAFGDTGWGQMRGQTTQAQDAARSGLVGNAYTSAFNTAIGAGAQDVANNMSGQTTNANLAETALGRQLTGANAQQASQTSAANLQNAMGGQQTAQSQADLNAKYNQWQMAQQYPFLTSQNLNQTIAAATPGAGQSGTSTTSSPDNSGWGILGSLGGSALSSNMFGGGGSAAGAGFGATSTLGGDALASAAPAMLAFLADGGKATAGQPTIVGERGPELMVPGANGVVIPNEVLEAARKIREKKHGKPKSNIKFGIAA